MEGIIRELKSPTIKNVDIVYGAKITGYELCKTNANLKSNIVKMNNQESYTCDLLVSHYFFIIS